MFNIKKNIYSSANSRDFYKGKSFEFAGNWEENVHYICDDYKVSFITKDGVLLACIKSHKSNEDSEPKIQYNSETHIPEIISDYWTIVVYGLPGVNIANIYFDYPNLVVTLSNGQTVRIDLGTDLKADKVEGATNGNFAGLNAYGNLIDSGSKASDFATKEQGEKADTAVQPITGGTENNFISIDSSGNIKDSGKNANDFSTATNIVNGSGTNSVQQKGGASATGNCSFAEGKGNAGADYAHAEGQDTETNNSAEHAEGKYNISITGATIHTVGIGTSSERKNAHLITNDGKHYIPGIGNYNGTETDLTGKSDLKTVIDGKQTTLVSEENIKTINEVSILGSGNIAIGGTTMQTVTYSELKALRDGKGLQAGMQYRITDYQCTTSQEDTSAENHQFDIIVTATSNNTLSEEARAVKHTDDPSDYFANSNLEAWKIWYCLDNDTNRFEWAGAKEVTQITLQHGGSTNAYTENGNENIGGTYYYCWGNQYYTENRNPIITDGIYAKNYPYPGGFGIITHVSSITEEQIGKGVIYRMIDEFGNDCPYDFKNIKFRVGQYDYYTFQDKSNNADASLNKIKCYGNVIKPYIDNGIRALNKIYFELETQNERCCSNTFGNDCYDICLDYMCCSNTFGNSCFSIYCESSSCNIIGSGVSHISIVSEDQEQIWTSS